MNKQELIKHFEELPYVSIHQMGKKSFIDLIEKLDEPQKLIVPQFVADWYEENEDNFETNLFQFIESLEVAPCEEDNLIEFIGWLMDKDTKPFQTLVNMHQFGYEIEEEKRYRVRFKGLDKDLEYLNFKHGHVWVFSDNIENEEYRTHHTRKELEEANFGWVFDCPGIEVEEVEG